MHREYWYPLYLDLYLRPGEAIGAPVDVNGGFAGSASDIPGWSLPPEGVQLEPDGTLGRAISLESDGAEERYLIGSHSAAANLYQLDFEVRSTLTSGGARAFLICASADGAWTDVYPDAGGALDVPADGEWHSVMMVGLCSAGTDHVLVDMRNWGEGTVSFRRVGLRGLPVPEG